jgi:probable HAF family extracellular repeat protein
VGNGINAAGQVVGSSDITGSKAAHPFLFTAGSMVDLGTLGGTSGSAGSINGFSQVVGESLTSGDAADHAFLWQNGVMLDLNSLILPGSGWSELTVATAISDGGEIVGIGILNGQERAFLLTPVSTRKLTGAETARFKRGIQQIINQIRAEMRPVTQVDQTDVAIGKLQAAMAQLDRGKIEVARNLLRSFVLRVNDFDPAVGLSAAQRQALTAAAQAIITQLGG